MILYRAPKEIFWCAHGFNDNLTQFYDAVSVYNAALDISLELLRFVKIIA